MEEHVQLVTAGEGHLQRPLVGADLLVVAVLDAALVGELQVVVALLRLAARVEVDDERRRARARQQLHATKHTTACTCM